MDAAKSFRRMALLLLWFNAVTACLGAASLLQAPNGESLNYDLKWLEATPFSDYFWPAIILLVANGLLCILAAVLTHMRVKGHPWFIMFQGFVLAGWLAAELMWGIRLLWLQAGYLCIAIGMIWSGNKLRRLE
jgi:hypothetical protein